MTERFMMILLRNLELLPSMGTLLCGHLFGMFFHDGATNARLICVVLDLLYTINFNIMTI